jgi:aldose 1-epimerase
MLTLSRGDDSLVVAPEAGGAILGWTRGGAHLLRHPSPEAALHGRPGDMGLFPLVPYCNRIAWRRFTWDGRAHELAANFGDHPHAIHGVGWKSPWRIEQVSAAAVTLSLHHDPVGTAARSWPFAFAARLEYRLMDAGLRIRIEATNLHSDPVPMGIGVHPWFPRPDGAVLAFQADGVWLNRDALPVTHVPVPAAWRHTDGRTVDSEMLDNCFTGWDGVARLPGARIEAEAVFANLQVFTPAGANFFCVEPVSHVPDAINRPDLPPGQAMAMLAEGQTLGGQMTFVLADAA